MEDTHTSNPTAAATDSFQVIAELDPPKGINLDSFLDTALNIRGRVDSVQVTDSEHAIMRMSPLAPCLALLEKNITPTMVLNGRDRNRISFQADLLAAAAMGIQNIMIKEGHDPAEGDQPMVHSSGDLELKTMIKCVAAMNNGTDLAGEPLDQPTNFNLGVYLELSDDVKVNRTLADSFTQMADAGVQTVTLGPTYDINIVESFLPAAEKTGIRLYTSIMFLKSVAMVRYLNNLPGVPSVPNEYLKKLMHAPVKQDGGMQVAADFFQEVRTIGDGTVLLAIGWRDRLPEFLTMLGR